jgi:hypothetical protein
LIAERPKGLLVRNTYQSFPQSERITGTHQRFGLTGPAIVDAYVNQRINDPSLLSGLSGPSYADFFAAPTQ